MQPPTLSLAPLPLQPSLILTPSTLYPALLLRRRAPPYQTYLLTFLAQCWAMGINCNWSVFCNGQRPYCASRMHRPRNSYSLHQIQCYHKIAWGTMAKDMNISAVAASLQSVINYMKSHSILGDTSSRAPRLKCLRIFTYRMLIQHSADTGK